MRGRAVATLKAAPVKRRREKRGSPTEGMGPANAEASQPIQVLSVRRHHDAAVVRGRGADGRGGHVAEAGRCIAAVDARLGHRAAVLAIRVRVAHGNARRPRIDQRGAASAASAAAACIAAATPVAAAGRHAGARHRRAAAGAAAEVDCIRAARTGRDQSARGEDENESLDAGVFHRIVMRLRECRAFYNADPRPPDHGPVSSTSVTVLSGRFHIDCA